MSMNPLPPQAYTKDTLAKAFAWLQAQNESIKELASSPDILVSLYLKTKMQGEGSLERPSIQNFKNELKSLAGMMGEFEVAETSPPTPPTHHQAQQQFNHQQHQALQQQQIQQRMSAQAAAAAPQPQAPTQASMPLSNLDPKSLAMIQEVKASLNLSSDSEALRVLIAVGFRGVKGLLG